MSNRYSDCNRINGKLCGKLNRLMVNVFDSPEALRKFVNETFGRDACHNINWSQALTYLTGDVISYCQSCAGVGKLIDGLLKVQSENIELESFAAYLVEAGYLDDAKQPSVPQAPNCRNWMSEFGFDRAMFDTAHLNGIAGSIARSFPSVGSFERFLVGQFDNSLGQQLRMSLSPTDSVVAAVNRSVNELHRLRWLNCFIMAVHAFDPKNGEVAFIVAAINATYNLSVKEQTVPAATTQTTTAPSPAGLPPQPVVAVTTQPVLSPQPEKRVSVKRATGKLTPAHEKELTQLMLRAFDKTGVDRLVRDHLAVRLDHIVASGPLGKVCDDLVLWCQEQEGKLVPLLNGILSERPGRTDVKPLLEKFAADGVIELV